MILSVERIKQLIDFKDWTDEKIEMKLLAVEQTIRAYTNNNFQDRGYRVTANISGGTFSADSPVPFSVGDTVQISESEYNNGLFTVSAVDENTFTVAEDTRGEKCVLVTKVVYPADVVAACVNLMEWECINRGKVGIQSETLSRHSVTYFNMDGANQIMGYPASLLGCLKAYKKVRC
jgi:hypothetical protein